MNKYLRILFLPIMILAGIFTSTMCALIFTPIAIIHWWQERKLIPVDYSNDDEYVKKYHAEINIALTKYQQK